MPADAEARIPALNVLAMVNRAIADGDGDLDVDAIVQEIEEEVLGKARTIRVAIALSRPLLNRAVSQGLRLQMRA
jgi:hypothetical protein